MISNIQFSVSRFYSYASIFSTLFFGNGTQSVHEGIDTTGNVRSSHNGLGIAFTWPSNARLLERIYGNLRRRTDISCKALLLWGESNFLEFGCNPLCPEMASLDTILRSCAILDIRTKLILNPNLTRSGGRLNKKDGLTRYANSHVKDKTS